MSSIANAESASAADNLDGDGTTSQGYPGTSSVASVTYRGTTVQVQQGTILRTALLKAGLTPHNAQAQVFNCRGLGSCGTCAVQIRGPVEPLKWNIQERLRLNFPPHGPPNNERLRLACQVQVFGDLEVTKYAGMWGQLDARCGDIVPGEIYDKPLLGPLEFVTDLRSPRQ